MQDKSQSPDGFLNLEATREFAGSPGVSTLYKWMSEGTFPKPYPIGANRRGWKVCELIAWRDALQPVEYRTKEAA